MNIAQLVNLAKNDPLASKRAAKQFAETLKARNREFQQDAQRFTPGPGFYDRAYTV